MSTPAAPAEVVPAAPAAPDPQVPSSHEADAARFFAADPTPGVQPARPPGTPAPALPPVDSKPAAAEPAAATPEAAPPPAISADDAPPAVPVKGLAGKLAAKAKTAAAPEPKKEPAADDPVAKELDELRKVPAPGSHPKNAEQWATMKSKYERIISGQQEEMKAIVKREAEARKKAESMPGPITAEELQKLRDEHKAFSDRLMVLDLKSHPQYQRQFVEPVQGAIAQAKELLAANKVEGVDVERLLALPRAEFGKAVSEAAKNLSAFDQTDFAAQMRSAYQIRQQEELALRKADETRSALQHKSGEMGRVAFARTAEKLATATGEWLPTVETDANATQQQRAADEEYNAAIGSLREEAERIAFAATTEEDIAANAFKAAAFEIQNRHVMPRLLGEYNQLHAEYAKVVEELAGLRARNPNRDRLHAAPGGEGGADLSKMSHEEAARHLAGQG